MSGLEVGTWMLVADGERALFLGNEGDIQSMHLKAVTKEDKGG